MSQQQQSLSSKKRKAEDPSNVIIAATALLAKASADDNNENNNNDNDDAMSESSSVKAGKLEELKQKEAELSAMLEAVRNAKLSALRARPLTIGIVGFGRFGQFIARTFSKYGRVVVTSRSDYTEIADGMGAKYVPLSNPDAFLKENLDVIVIAVSITSFKSTVKSIVPHIQKWLDTCAGVLPNGLSSSCRHGPLVVDVLSVKEHARKVMLELLPKECDIMCTHPMFGPDSGKNGWNNLNFVYEKTRIDGVVLDPDSKQGKNDDDKDTFLDEDGKLHSVHENTEAHVEGMDRMERFLSIWEEEGCRMVQMSCREHDAYAANSQFITHLVGRVLGNQGLSQTPIDTSGFQSVLKLIDSTTADSFDLFYGLYKYNDNSLATIKQLQSAMEEVVVKLQATEDEENQKQQAKVAKAAKIAAAETDSNVPDEEKPSHSIVQ